MSRLIDHSIDTAVVLPARIPIPRPVLKVLADICVYIRILPPPGPPLRRAHVNLNFITVPLLSVLILLASGAINATVVRNGIVGADGVQPLDIMALFMSLVHDSWLCHALRRLDDLAGFIGILIYLSGRDRLAQVSSFLGGSDGRLIRPKIVCVFLCVFPFVRRDSGECK